MDKDILSVSFHQIKRYSHARPRILNYFESAYMRVVNTEEFIENKFAIDIRYSLKIDCIIKQDGYRPTFLRELLRGVIE